MKKGQKIDMQELEECKAQHDLDTLREAVRVKFDIKRMRRVRRLAHEEINELALAASLNVEIS